MSSSKLAALLALGALLCASAIGAAPAAALPDPPPPSTTTLLRQLSQATGGAARIAWHAATGKARFLSTGSQQPLWRPSSLAAATPEQASRAFLSSYGQLFGLRGQPGELALMRQEHFGGHDFV